MAYPEDDGYGDGDGYRDDGGGYYDDDRHSDIQKR